MSVMKRLLFYILSFTWGAIMSIIGLIIMIIPFGHDHVFHGRLYKTVGNNWGGVNFGCFFLCAQNADYDLLKAHECGHGLQNILWGPLYPFIIAIPSAIRYWYFEWCDKHDKPIPEYEAIWFEAQATRWGRQHILTDRW